MSPQTTHRGPLMLGANRLLRLIATLGILASGVAFAEEAGDSETSPGYSLRDSIPRLERYYDLSLGRRVFTGKCLVCHGVSLNQGQPAQSQGGAEKNAFSNRISCSTIGFLAATGLPEAWYSAAR